MGSPAQACGWEREGRWVPMCSCRSLQGDLAGARRAAVASRPDGGRRVTLGLEASRSKVRCNLLRAQRVCRVGTVTPTTCGFSQLVWCQDN